MALSIFGMVLALLVLIFGTYKRWGIIPCTILASLILILTSRLNIWEAFSVNYASGFGSSFTSFILLFLCTCVYSKFMDVSGSAKKIALTILNVVGKKNVITACGLACGLLVFGGINSILPAFVMLPIMFTLFHEADIPKKFMIPTIFIGNGTWAVGFLPFTTQVTNIVPANYLGTGLGAGGLMGTIAGIACCVWGLTYLNRAVKKSQAAGEHFEYPKNIVVNAKNDQEMPATAVAFLPLVCLLGICVIGTHLVSNATMLSIIAVLISAGLCLVLNYSRIKKYDIKATLTQACSEALPPIGNLACVTGMAAILRLAPGYMYMVNAILNSNMNVYAKACLATILGCLPVGSSMAGLSVVFETTGQYFLTSGANLGYLHRLMSMISMPATGFPNCAGHYLHLGLVEETQATVYKHTFNVIVLPGFVISIICLLGTMFIWG